MSTAPIDISALLEVREGVCGGRPCIQGTRTTVHTIVECHALMSPTEILESFPGVTLAGLHAALAYYYTHKDEVDAQVRADDALIDHAIRTGVVEAV